MPKRNGIGERTRVASEGTGHRETQTAAPVLAREWPEHRSGEEWTVRRAKVLCVRDDHRLRRRTLKTAHATRLVRSQWLRASWPRDQGQQPLGSRSSCARTASAKKMLLRNSNDKRKRVASEAKRAQQQGNCGWKHTSPAPPSSTHIAWENKSTATRKIVGRTHPYVRRVRASGHARAQAQRTRLRT